MLTLTVPGLLARGTPALAATAPFRSFARYADPPVLNREGSASALCAALGLPLPERRQGLAAHDFFMLACGAEVFLTRSGKENGMPTTPSRWQAAS